MDTASCKLIAEIGASHAGSLERALLLTVLAAESGADVVKEILSLLYQKTLLISHIQTHIFHTERPTWITGWL